MAHKKSFTSDETSQDFISRLAGMTCAAYINNATALGSKLGIFDVMVQFTEPQSCDEIAKKGNWKPRYIQEWLALMVCGKIIDYHPDTKTYYLPEHRHIALNKLAPMNFSVLAEVAAIFMQVHFELEKCFPVDGPKGIPYNCYNSFHDVRLAMTKGDYSLEIILELMAKIPNMINKLESGIRVCEPGCGGAHQLMLLAEHFPKSIFIGLDFEKVIIDETKSMVAEKAITNICLEHMDVENMPDSWKSSFDMVMTWDMVHDLPRPQQFLNDMVKILKPGAVFFMNDFRMNTELADNIDIPVAAMVYGISLYHCMPISLECDGEGAGTAWGVQKQRKYMENAGFKDIDEITTEKTSNLQSYFVAYSPK